MDSTSRRYSASQREGRAPGHYRADLAPPSAPLRFQVPLVTPEQVEAGRERGRLRVLEEKNKIRWTRVLLSAFRVIQLRDLYVALDIYFRAEIEDWEESAEEEEEEIDDDSACWGAVRFGISIFCGAFRLISKIIYHVVLPTPNLRRQWVDLILSLPPLVLPTSIGAAVGAFVTQVGRERLLEFLVGLLGYE
jgi:hypothetical protein